MGGGGSSGKVSYPNYIETTHLDWLVSSAATTMTANLSVTDALNTGFGANPYTAITAYDPATPITALLASVDSFSALADAFIVSQVVDPTLEVTPGITVPGAVANPVTVLTDANITADTAAHAAVITALKDNQLTSDIMPRFEAGMRDINAVMSSAFVVGRAIIESEATLEITRQSAKHDSQLRLAARPTDVQAADVAVKIGAINLERSKVELAEHELELKNAELILSAITGRLEFQKSVMMATIESQRIKIVALKEQEDRDLEIDNLDAMWELQLFTHAGNLLAAPAGGTAIPGKTGSAAASAIGGALSGAAMGAMAGATKGSIGGPAGAAVGGVVGLVGGLLSR